MNTSISTRQQVWGLEQRALASSGSLSIPQSPLSLRYKARRALQQPREHRTREVARRALNLFVAVLGIALTAPLMIVIALLVRVTSRGPVIFRQQRVGIDRRAPLDQDAINRRRSRDLGGTIFTIYKFRTMRVDATAKEVWASRDDPRVTPVGRFLRATRLDELPQFFNVLKGDMNIVGPRPEQPEIFQNLREKLGRYGSRQQVLPGITGLAQIEVGYDTDIEGVQRKVALDLEYIRRRSAAKDLMIMARTVPVMVFKKVWM